MHLIRRACNVNIREIAFCSKLCILLLRSSDFNYTPFRTYIACFYHTSIVPCSCFYNLLVLLLHLVHASTTPCARFNNPFLTPQQTEAAQQQANIPVALRDASGNQPSLLSLHPCIQPAHL